MFVSEIQRDSMKWEFELQGSFAELVEYCSL